jgi:UDP-N-acetylmuramate--alanine ligase
MLDVNKLSKVHLLGVGGVSMSSIALILTKWNISVSGCDRIFSERLLTLSEAGCLIFVGTQIDILDKVDLVVYSSAIKQDSDELIYCKNHNIPTMERYEFLGEISKRFQKTIAISGTHGKTTTTSMFTRMLMDASELFCAHIGGDAIGIGNFQYSGEKYFLTEACEYRQSLLSLRPYISIILNVESDHPDTYKNLDELYNTFDNFISFSTFSIINGDSEYYKSRQKYNKELITYGEEEHNHYVINNVKLQENGCYCYDINHFGFPLCTVSLNIEGYHNIYNSTAVIIAGQMLKLCLNGSVKSIENFLGVSRRFEILGLCEGALIISDYAHHPTEIKASIKTARLKIKNNGKLFVVFQPHTYSRTYSLFNEFLKCLNDCDYLILCKEYSARETPDMGLSAKQLFDNIEHKNKFYHDNIIDIAAFLIEKINPDDIVLILGAGDIDNLGKILLMK